MIRAANGMPLPYVNHAGRILHGPHCSCVDVPGKLAGEPHPLRPPQRCDGGEYGMEGCPCDIDDREDGFGGHEGLMSFVIVPCVFITLMSVGDAIPWQLGYPFVALAAGSLYGFLIWLEPWLHWRRLQRLKAQRAIF